VRTKIILLLVTGFLCVGRAHAHETFQLSPDDGTVIYPDGSQSTVTTTDCKTNATKILADFNAHMADANEVGKLVSCELETSTWYIHVMEFDYSAGVFTLEKDGARSKVAVCYNGAVGSVVLKPVSSMTRHELVVFMMGNCTSG
jgi:hypothetical protein